MSWSWVEEDVVPTGDKRCHEKCPSYSPEGCKALGGAEPPLGHLCEPWWREEVRLSYMEGFWTRKYNSDPSLLASDAWDYSEARRKIQ